MFNLAPVGMGRATFRLQEILQIGPNPHLILTRLTSLTPPILALP